MGKTAAKKQKEIEKGRRPYKPKIKVDKKETFVIEEDVDPHRLIDIIQDELWDKRLTKIRIFEGDQFRVRDFSVCNCKMSYEDEERVVFRFDFKGDPINWVYFVDNCDVGTRPGRNLIEVRVQGPVYWADGTRRYEGRQEWDRYPNIKPLLDYKLLMFNYEELKFQFGNIFVSTSRETIGSCKIRYSKYLDERQSWALIIKIPELTISSDNLGRKIDQTIRDNVMGFATVNSHRILDFWNNGASWDDQKVQDFRARLLINYNKFLLDKIDD